MGKIILFNMMSLDGYFEGPGNDLSWHRVDAEFNEFAIEQLSNVNALIFGRRTYELMAGYWPTKNATNDDPKVAAMMNSAPKIVFSRTLASADWNNTAVLQDEIEAEAKKLRAHPADSFILGSAKLAASFTAKGLIDEYRVMINPVIMGNGTPLFKPGGGKLDLKLLGSRVFGSGNVLLTYRPS